jgi:CubicO group peptidase (beta-lactamase class C family)
MTLVVILALALGQAGSVAADLPTPSTPLPLATPQSQGLSRSRLDRLDAFMRASVDTTSVDTTRLDTRRVAARTPGQYGGAVVLVARNGHIVEWRAYGHRDVAGTKPMERDSIFRIYSMTKTMASVAALLLMEEGKLALEDPVSKYIPEFANVQVFVGGTAEAPLLRAPKRPVTVRQLFTHVAGFATGSRDPAGASELLRNAHLYREPDLKTFSEKLARLPLGADPGDRYAYDGTSTNVLGRVIEVVAGKPLDVFMRERLFEPLRLEDTGFTVASGKRARVVEMTSTDADGKLVPSPAYAGTQAGEMIGSFPSPAGGLYSTAGDYARFCQMLLNGGELDGVAILGRKTVELMMSNHLTHLDPPVTEFSESEGMGLGGYVVLDVARRGRPGSVGQFGWSGAAGTYYTIDRLENLTAILMTQHLPQGLPADPPKISFRFYNLVYQSLVK